MVNGDCAFGVGLPGDYATFLAGVQPLSAAGIPLHFSLGNHDHRENFRAGMLPGVGGALLEGKHVSVVEGKRANWFILDTLDKTNSTPGLLGEPQLKWVEEALETRKDRTQRIAEDRSGCPLVKVNEMRPGFNLFPLCAPLGPLW